jgi:hypothetical protein
MESLLKIVETIWNLQLRDLLYQAIQKAPAEGAERTKAVIAIQDCLQDYMMTELAYLKSL